MLTAVIIIFVLLIIMAALVGLLQFFTELEELHRRSQNYTDMMEGFENVEKEDGHE